MQTHLGHVNYKLKNDAKVHLAKLLEDRFNAKPMFHHGRPVKFRFEVYSKLNEVEPAHPAAPCCCLGLLQTLPAECADSASSRSSAIIGTSSSASRWMRQSGGSRRRARARTSAPSRTHHSSMACDVSERAQAVEMATRSVTARAAGSVAAREVVGTVATTGGAARAAGSVAVCGVTGVTYEHVLRARARREWCDGCDVRASAASASAT
jgi:hypothetical protein